MKKDVVNKFATKTILCSPSFPTAPVPPMRFPLIPSTHVALSHKAGKEPEPPVQMAVKRRSVKTIAASTSSADSQRPALQQVQSSRFPGGMGEERRTAYVANKINEGKATNYLPKSPAVLTPSILPIPIPTAPPSETPHELEYASKVTAL